MADSIKSLVSRVEALERKDDMNSLLIADMERKNKKLSQQVKDLEKSPQGKTEDLQALQARKDECVFCARLSLDDNVEKTLLHLGTDWKHINKCDMMYRASPSFDADDCMFTAPNKGDYFMGMGVRQKSKGGLEVMLILLCRVGSSTESKHAYIGRTMSEGETCHKSMVVSLNAGDKVHGVVRLLSRGTTINWCTFNGYMITDTSANVA